MVCRLDGAKPLSEPMIYIVNWILRNKLKWKYNRHSSISIHENAIESVVCKMAAILSRPQCVNETCGYCVPSDSIQIKLHSMNEIVYMTNSTIFKCWRYVYYCALEEPITLVIVFMWKINVFRVQKLNSKVWIIKFSYVRSQRALMY